jgi:hypothetical protein
VASKAAKFAIASSLATRASHLLQGLPLVDAADGLTAALLPTQPLDRSDRCCKHVAWCLNARKCMARRSEGACSCVGTYAQVTPMRLTLSHACNNALTHAPTSLWGMQTLCVRRKARQARPMVCACQHVQQAGHVQGRWRALTRAESLHASVQSVEFAIRLLLLIPHHHQFTQSIICHSSSCSLNPESRPMSRPRSPLCLCLPLLPPVSRTTSSSKAFLQEVRWVRHA